MKNQKAIALASLLFLTSLPFLTAQAESTSEDLSAFDDITGFDDFDSLFDDATDTDQAITSEKDVLSAGTVQKAPQIVTFFGSMDASVGWAQMLKPESNYSPYSAFDAVFGFTARPSDVLTIKGSVYTSFPAFNISLYTFYFDYILLGKYYITAGRTKTNWGNSAIFDTNILDDEGNSAVNNVLNPDKYSAAKEFTILLTVPVGAGSFQGLSAFSGTSTEDGYAQFMWYAASFEYPVFGTSVKLFARTWADADQYRMDPLAGIELTGDFFDFHLYAHGELNAPKDDISADGITHRKLVAGIGRRFEEPAPKIAFDIEYLQEFWKNRDYTTHQVSFQGKWSSLAGTKVSAGVKLFHDIKEHYGEVLPGISISGLPHATLDLGLPVCYGGYQDSTYSALIKKYTGSSDRLVILGLKLTLSVSF